METIPALQQAFGNMFQPNVFLAVFAATIALMLPAASVPSRKAECACG